MKARGLLILLAAGTIAGCSSAGSGATAPRSASGATGATVSTGVSTSSTASTTSTTAATGPAAGQTATTNPAGPAASGAIVITAPRTGQTVASPLVVNGTSDLGSVEVDLTDAAGNVLASSTTVPNAGRFSVTLRFAAPAQPGTLTAFRTGPGGVHEDITQVPVRLSD